LEAAVEDFDIPQNKMAESAERVVDRALDEARRREHALLTNEHVCLAFGQVEWDMFGQVMRDLELNPHEILQAIEEHLRLLPSVPGRELRVAPSTKLLFKLALLHASRSGRHTIEASDLFSAIFEETQGIPVSIIRRHGIEPEMLVTRLATRMRDHEMHEERLKKRFELPPFLKHCATGSAPIPCCCLVSRVSARRRSPRDSRVESSSNRSGCRCACVIARSSTCR
jgi:ATP-dependent Clp protease ATP-binding subunit ClpA